MTRIVWFISFISNALAPFEAPASPKLARHRTSYALCFRSLSHALFFSNPLGATAIACVPQCRSRLERGRSVSTESPRNTNAPPPVSVHLLALVALPLSSFLEPSQMHRRGHRFERNGRPVPSQVGRLPSRRRTFFLGPTPLHRGSGRTRRLCAVSLLLGELMKYRAANST